MPMKLTEVRTAALRRAVKALYKSTFPLNERKPFSVILKKQKTGQMELLAITDDAEEFCGLVITILYRDLVLLDYFAVCPSRRGRNIGTTTLSLIRKRYPDRRLILEIEDPDAPCDNREERLRRRAFYLRNGMEIMPFRVDLFGVEMLILTAGGAVSFDEYHALFPAVFSDFIARFVKLL